MTARLATDVRPVRLQLSRKRGFTLQELSRATNGLEAVNVARPSRWGNPIAVGSEFISGKGGEITEGKVTPELAVARFRELVTRIDVPEDFETGRIVPEFSRLFPDIGEITRHLRGKNLACWCPLDQPHCHANVLLELANDSGESA